jgi:hypothetical protein
LLLLLGRWQRGQEARVAQQIAVTEAIHRELGAVVAPSMAKNPWGAPRLVIPVPFECPNLVVSVLAIAHRVLRGQGGAIARRTEIVLVPQAERSATAERRAA